MSGGQWIKCSERMPKPLALCLGWLKRFEQPTIVEWGGDRWRYAFDGETMGTPPTHWMPLPAPPKPEEAAQ